jgi:hypothetical protein
MKRTALGLLAAAGVVCAFGLAAQATTLDFGNATAAGGSCVESGASPCIGDNVNSTSDAFSTYGMGNGFTTNITTDYSGPNHRLVAVGASHGGGNVFGTNFNGSQYTFTLNAAAGFNVQLNDVTIKNTDLPGLSQTETFEVWADGAHLSSLDFTYSGVDPASFSLAGLVAQSISIIADSAFVGIAGVNFDQVAIAATPIPAALPLFASGLAGLGFARWRKNKPAVKAV